MKSLRAWLLSLLLLAAATADLPAQSSAPKSAPNIIFILADDLGWTDIGCQGSKYYETPNIDRLASQGLRLTSFYQSQNCAPTRAALMSGQYAPRTGVYTVGSLERGAAKDRKMNVPANATRLPLDRVTLAQALKEGGYATAIFGKWHLGEQGAYHPSQRGFDAAITTMGKHYQFTTKPKIAVPPDRYLADFLTDQAEQFIDKNQQRPFFLYLAHFGVHSPYVAKKELIEKYRRKPPVGEHKDPVYAAMIESIDQSVGRIMKKLDELKLADNTLIIFSSDNGGVGGYLAAGVRARGITSNAPLRGGKGMLYEGGLRVPFILRWPGQVPPGRSSDVPCAHVDLYPTLVEIAGKKTRPRQTLDGVSLVNLWQHPDAKLDRDALFFHFPGYLEGNPGAWRTTPCGMMRAGDFTLLEFFEDGRLELYNVKDDLGQRRDLAKQMPEKTRALHERMAAWRKMVHAPLPTLK